jgi:outer membrane lipoprotein
MIHPTRIPIVLLSAAFAILSGCATYPISQKYREAARKDVTVPLVQQQPQTYQGALVIWGGAIIQVLNDSTGSQLMVLESPLGPDGYPESPVHSRGRFLALTDRFLDPLVYKKGRKVTLAGEVAGTSRRKLGEGSYVYPQIVIKEMRYWLPAPQYYYTPYYNYPYDYPFYSPFYGPAFTPPGIRESWPDDGVFDDDDLE